MLEIPHCVGINIILCQLDNIIINILPFLKLNVYFVGFLKANKYQYIDEMLCVFIAILKTCLSKLVGLCSMIFIILYIKSILYSCRIIFEVLY